MKSINKKVDKKQNKRIDGLARQLKMVTASIGRIKLVKASAQKKTKQKKARATRRAHPRNAGLLTSEHSQPTFGLMDAVPTTAVVSRGQSTAVLAANEYCLFMGIGDHHNNYSTYSDTSTSPATDRQLRSIQSISYRFNNAGGAQGWGPTSTNNAAVTSTPQYSMNPYSVDASFKSKVNKMTLHLSFLGTQALMSTEFRIFIDYHGDLMGEISNSGATLIDTFNRVFNHPRCIKVKVESGSSIDYVVPFVGAKLETCTTQNISDYLANAVGQMQVCQANSDALTDERSYFGSLKWFYRRESTNATVNVVDQGICSTPLVYVVCAAQVSAQISVTCTMDCEFHDESLYSVSTPSICDLLS